jgi:hypothetical protein
MRPPFDHGLYRESIAASIVPSLTIRRSGSPRPAITQVILKFNDTECMSEEEHFMFHLPLFAFLADLYWDVASTPTFYLKHEAFEMGADPILKACGLEVPAPILILAGCVLEALASRLAERIAAALK